MMTLEYIIQYTVKLLLILYNIGDVIKSLNMIPLVFVTFTIFIFYPMNVK